MNKHSANKMTKMKTAAYTAFACLTAILTGMLTGCADDELCDKRGNVVEGVPVTATMKLACSSNAEIVVDTRADNSLADIGNDLTIFIFDGNGKYQKAVSTHDQTLTVTGEETSDKGVKFTTSFETTSGTKKLLAVGNLWSNYWYTPENIQYLEDINQGKYNFEEVKKALYEIAFVSATNDEKMPISITSSEQMPVSGYSEGVIINTDGSVNLSGATYADATDGVAVRMKRALASITFSITAGNTGNGEFVPTSYQVYNLPTHVYMVNMDGSGHPDGYTSYVNYREMNAPAVSNEKYTFQFYMPGNIYGNADGVTSYDDREAWSGASGSDHKSKQWTNAPQNSTFVVIKGTYNGKANVNGTQTDVSATVEYTIHLGDFSPTGSTGNFSVERNCAYTYNVTVKGVDNIIVEAKKSDPDERYQHGAEGSVYDTQNMDYNYQLDAHYEQVFLEYNLSSIAESVQGQSGTALDEAISNQLILVVQSPAMPERIRTVEPYKIYATAANPATAKTDALEGKVDYKWIEFLPQSGSGIADYPGIPDWARQDLTGMKNQDYYGGTATAASAGLMDAYDILVDMGKAVRKIHDGETLSTGTLADGNIIIARNSSGDYVARFTAFVDEYYWLRNPLTGESVTWAEFTNTIPREMIIAMSSDTSADGNSSYRKVHSYISQLSMQTFYDGTNPEISAFGLETYNETPITNDGTGIAWGTPKANTNQIANLSETDGRSNQITLIGGGTSGTLSGNLLWSTFIRNNYTTGGNTYYNGWTSSENTVTDHTKHKLPSGIYREGAYAACLSRNRDLNGNGTIDDNEVRWFLASVGGYIRIGMGSNAISNEAQLYIGDKSQITQSGYAQNFITEGSLFYTSSRSGERIYWAVEKGAIGPDGVDWVGGSTTPKPIRCLRTLSAQNGEHDLSSVSGVSSTSLYEYIEGSGDTPDVLKFKGRMESALYRQRTNSTLEKHDEDGNANSFSEGIFVASTNLDNTYALGSITGLNGGTMQNPCSTYSEGGYSDWRVPNLVELTAIYFAYDKQTLYDNFNNVICCTQSSTADNTSGPVRFGFRIHGNNSADINVNALGEGYSSITNFDNATATSSQWPYNEYYTNRFNIRCVRDVPAGYFNN